MSEDKFDGALLAVLQNCGELEPFLDVILGFLHRKTDFFRHLSADRSMGFPPGVARDKLLKVQVLLFRHSFRERSDFTRLGMCPHFIDYLAGAVWWGHSKFHAK